MKYRAHINVAEIPDMERYSPFKCLKNLKWRLQNGIIRVNKCLYK